jgi:hypothetical protein
VVLPFILLPFHRSGRGEDDLDNSARPKPIFDARDRLAVFRVTQLYRFTTKAGYCENGCGTHP